MWLEKKRKLLEKLNEKIREEKQDDQDQNDDNLTTVKLNYGVNAEHKHDRIKNFLG